MADLVDCSRCGRRFVESAADRVAGRLVCPACVSEAKAEAAAAELARKVQAGRGPDPSRSQQTPPADPTPRPVPPCPQCGGPRQERTSANWAATAMKWIGLVLTLGWGTVCAMGPGRDGLLIVGVLLAMGILLGGWGYLAEQKARSRRFWICAQCDTAEEAPKRAQDV